MQYPAKPATPTAKQVTPERYKSSCPEEIAGISF